MKNFLTIQNEDLSETVVEEPQSEYGFTYADYLTWQFKERIELIQGKIFKMSPAPTLRHQDILSNVFIFIKQHIDGGNCKAFIAPVDVRLKGRPFRNRVRTNDEITTVVQPDMIVVCDKEKYADMRSIDGAPDMVVEI